MSLEIRWALSCEATTRSNIYGGDSGQFECLGHKPELREFMICVMSEKIAGKQSLTRWDGMRSRTQVNIVGGHRGEQRGDSGKLGGGEKGCCRSLFVWKNERKELHMLTVKELGVGGCLWVW